jgi:alkylation response protein AidB-like acyl-CoA dehydrogenase
MSAVQKSSLNPLAEGGAFLLEENGIRPIFSCEDFSEEQRMFFKTADDFAATEIGNRTQEIDDRGLEMMPSLLKKAADLGLCMVEIPETYGGLGRDVTTSMLVTEAMSRNGSWSTTWGAHTGIGTLPIVFFGNEAQKKKYLPKLATTEIIGAYALSEAGSGSDALGARTKAVLSKDGKHYVLNGGKMWITNSRWAGTFIVFAKVDGDKFTAFIVERETPGFHVQKEEHKIGLHGSSTCALMFEDAMVPVENVLGEIGKGHRIAFNILNHGRIKLGIGALGGCRHMLEAAVKYAKDRKQFGTAIVDFGLIRRKIAEMAAKTYALQAMGYRTAGLIDARIALVPATDPGHDKATIDAIEDHNIEASIMKVFGSEALNFCIDEALQIHGGYGFTEEYPIAKPYRDSRVNRIFEGTNEINRMLIPGTLLKRALKGKLPLMQFIGETEQELSGGKLPKAPEGLLGKERRATELAKRQFALVVGAAAMKFQAGLEKEQSILSDLADIAIDIFGMDSSVTRARQAVEKFGEKKASLHVDCTRLFVVGASERVTANARRIATETLEGADLEVLLGKIAKLDGSSTVNQGPLREAVVKQVVELDGLVLPTA